jgi:hypothetical protein
MRSNAYGLIIISVSIANVDLFACIVLSFLSYWIFISTVFYVVLSHYFNSISLKQQKQM